MSDAADAVARAVVANRKLAAGLLVRKQALEAELAAGGQGAAADALRAELAAVEVQLAAALAELAAVQKLGRDLPHEEARAVVSSATTEVDPLERTLEADALDRVRGHLADLEAELRLVQERAPEARPPTPEEAEADARRQLEELRAKHKPKPDL